MERTEEDKVMRAPVEVTLGGRDYRIAPLTIRHSSEWRIKFKPLLMFMFKCIHLRDGGNQEQAEQATVELLTDRMPEVIDCFFAYARELSREEIETTATDGEIFLAFLKVFKAFVDPFGQVSLMMGGQTPQ